MIEWMIDWLWGICHIEGEEKKSQQFVNDVVLGSYGGHSEPAMPAGQCQ